MWVSQTFGEETSSATEINMMILHNFIFLQRVYFLNLFAAIFVYVMTIVIVNREKYQIINVRAGASKHVTNFETGSDGKSHKAMREDLIK